MTLIEYVDDITETEYLINTDEEETTIKRSNPIEIPKSIIDSFRNKHVAYIDKDYTIKPYKGSLIYSPDDMIFATLNDYISYKEAWEHKLKRTNKKK